MLIYDDYHCYWCEDSLVPGTHTCAKNPDASYTVEIDDEDQWFVVEHGPDFLTVTQLFPLEED